MLGRIAAHFAALGRNGPAIRRTLCGFPGNAEGKLRS